MHIVCVTFAERFVKISRLCIIVKISTKHLFVGTSHMNGCFVVRFEIFPHGIVRPLGKMKMEADVTFSCLLVANWWIFLFCCEVGVVRG